MQSSLNGCGATIFGSKVSSSNDSTASITSRRSSPISNPDRSRRLGVLVDHLVSGGKEERVARRWSSPYVLFTGTPYIDVWTAVRPRVMGLERWPEIPKGQPFKDGVCATLGYDEPRDLWNDLLASVKSYKDLEGSVVGAVERLIDFVTTD